MTETKIVLICIPVIALSYSIVVVCKGRQFDLKELTLVMADAVGIFGGVSIFIYAFKMPDALSEQAKWTGIAGVCTAMLFLFQAISVFQKLLFPQSTSAEKIPEKKDDSKVSA